MGGAGAFSYVVDTALDDAAELHEGRVQPVNTVHSVPPLLR
jgi:hypothetical protein